MIRRTVAAAILSFVITDASAYGTRCFDSVAQEQVVDTLQLQEVTVKAAQQYVTSKSIVYIPTGSDKKNAQTATDLLRMSAIPQIKVNPVDDKIVDNFGDEVSVFINYLPARKDDIAGLKTSDVRKIEYLDSPTDPRFRGAKTVVNFIVAEYSYGGYTKISATLRTINGISGGVNIYSKIAYKKMTYDIYAALDESSTHHSGIANDDIYRLGTSGVTRKEMPLSAHQRLSRYPVTFRAIYNTHNIQLSNALAFSHIDTGSNDDSGVIEYHAPIGSKSAAFDRSNPNSSNSVMFLGSYYFDLSAGWALNIAPDVSYSHYYDNLSYLVTKQSPIIRQTSEDATDVSIDGNVEKTFSSNHVLTFGLSYGISHNTVDYRDYNHTETIRYQSSEGYSAYTFSKNGITTSIEGGLEWNRSKTGSESLNSISPFVSLDFRYNASQKSMLSANVQYKTVPPNSSLRTSTILQDNELMYISGNPSLHNLKNLTAKLGYNYISSQMLTLNAYASYRGLYDRIAELYMPYRDATALLRTDVNDGRYDRIMSGMSFTLKPLDGKLVINATPGYTYYQLTGPVSRHYSTFTLNASIGANLSAFYFNAYFKLQSREIDSRTNALWKDRNYYFIEAGWSNSSFNVRLNAANIFNRGWINLTQDMESELFSQSRTYFGSSYHPRLSLSVTYTISYGKKLQRRNEIGELSPAQSAIMK